MSGGHHSDAREFRGLSYWHDSLPGELETRPDLRASIQADVVIIGAGYTGLWTAWYLKEAQPALNVVILEAERAGFGASGRNGGWCSGYLSGIDHWLDDPAARDGALRLQRLMFEAVTDIGRIVDEASIDCHYERSGALEIAVNAGQLERLKQEWQHLQELGFAESDFEWLSRDQLQRRLAIAGGLAAIRLRHCAAIHPARLAHGLADRLEQRGVRIFEKSRVRGFNGRDTVTASGRVTAGTVVIATEGYGAGLPGRARELIPVHSMMVVTEPLDAQALDGLCFDRRYCFGNLDRIVTYGQKTTDGRIAFGCRGEYIYASGIRPRFTGREKVFDDVRETLLRFFPQLRGIRFTHAWGGALGVTRSLRPAIVFDAASRVGWAGGYFGNGVAASHLAGRTLADLVTGQDSERVRTPWVNPPDAVRQWEREPLRWLGFRVTRSLMSLADRAERRGNARLAQAIDAVLP